MSKQTKVILTLSLLILIAGLLRFYGNAQNPNSLNNDEVSYGYSAYSILKTGRDENGVFMPISFRSIGDYKNPILIYSLVPSIALFGLNEFAVRFTTALAGTLTIPVLFLLILSLVKKRKIALIGVALLTVSPWHIYYSRFASDHLVGLFLLILGLWFFQNMQKKRKIWAILAAFFLIISMYTYHSNRLFVPLFIFICLIINIKNRSLRYLNIKIFLLVSFILLLPLAHQSLFGAINQRASMVLLTQDIDYTRYVILDHLYRPGEYYQLFFFWAKRYLNYFQPDFLFFNGLNMTIPGVLGLGVLHLFELPWLILGIIELIKRKIENKGFIILWILLGIIPASLTNNEQSSGRSLIILPMLLLIISFGAMRFFLLLNHLKNKYLRIGLVSSYVCFIGIMLVYSLLVFAVHFPLQRGEAFMEGTKQTVLFALKNKDKYNEIIYDPYRGIDTPYIVNIPHMYILFYSKYDPELFQTGIKRYGKELFSFDKFTIRRIDWREDRYKKNSLFIGSPWSLPERDLKTAEILKRVYLSNGNLALLVVSPQENGNLPKLEIIK